MTTGNVATRFLELFDPVSWATWFAGLDRGFTFLLLLPFVVVIVAFWGGLRERDAEHKARQNDEKEP